MLGMEDRTPGFDDPLGVMRACHRRIAERLDLLERLPEYVELHGADAAAQSAARKILNYFERAAIHHHEDEEEDLFPMLRGAWGRADWDDGVLEVLEQLTVEHRTLVLEWGLVRSWLVALAGGKRVAPLCANDLVRSYRAHMAVEDEAIFPMASRLLGHRELQRLGAAMQKRRGLLTEGLNGETAE